jgi:hypothetical protein
MKKFLTAIPLQGANQLRRYVYDAVDNARLRMEDATAFPILTAIHGYAVPGEPFRIIAVVTDTASARNNFAVFREEVTALCEKQGLTCREITPVYVAADERVTVQLATFQKLIDLVDDDDELFACMTYGTKPLAQVMQMALQYGYRIKRNASIGCVVYGQIDRSGDVWRGSVYDMTALVQLDEIVRLLADRGVAQPETVIRGLLSL